MVSWHFGDPCGLRIAFRPLFENVLKKLQNLFHFGEWKDASLEKVKFCGQWESQGPVTSIS